MRLVIDKNIFTYLLFFLFFLLCSLYSYFTYITFSPIDIFKTSVAFFLLMIFLLITSKHINKVSRYPNGQEIILSIFFSMYFFLLIHFVELRFIKNYFQTFPLNYGFTHQDTAFHVSIIRSIMTFGYPSVGQHDTPVIFYHVLSHYIDAIILKITDLDPFESYGLMFFFKQTIFLISIIFFINKCFKNLHVKSYFFLSLFFFPLFFVSSWLFVASHGQWFASILLIFFFPVISKIIKKKNNFKDYIFIFFVIFFISLGKITLGATVGLLVCTALYLKNYKNLKIYIFATISLIFFYLFLDLIGRNLFAQFNFNIIEILNFALKQKELISIIVILTLFSIFTKDKNIINITIASFISFFVLSSVASAQEWVPDQSYLIFGYRFILILIVFQLISEILENNKIAFNKLNHFNSRCIIALSLIIFFIINPFKILNNNNNKFDLKNVFFERKKMVHNKDYANFDTLFKKIFSRNNDYLDKRKTSKLIFKNKLEKFMLENHLSPRNSLLFIPENIFQKQIKNRLGKKKIYQGLTLYAVTGVPLINSIYDYHPYYGLETYSKEHFRLNLDEFMKTDYCKFNKNIIITLHFIKGRFKLLKCSYEKI